MTVRDYYKAHFDELSKKKKFHLAVRMRNWFSDDSFDGFLNAEKPELSIAKILENDNYENVNYIEERRPYFEKYEGLYGLEAALVQTLMYLYEYNDDRREELLSAFGGVEKLYQLCDNLISDDAGFFTLTTFAVNVIALTEELFPRGNDVYKVMLEKALAVEQNEKSIYLYTHIVLCESKFYHAEIVNHKDLYLRAMESCDRIILENFDAISFDIKFEFLVCAEMVGYSAASKEKIRAEAEENKTDFVVDPRKPDRLNTLDGAEHRNVLYIMSGLDI